MMKLLAQTHGVPAALVETMRRDLEKVCPPESISVLIDRWTGLINKKKYHHPIAMRSARLNEVYIKEMGKYDSIEDILEESDDLIKIDSASHYMGRKYVHGHMALILQILFSHIKVGKQIEPIVFEDLFDMIIEEYPWITFADMRLCFKNGIKGKYGQTYDRIDTQVIFGWLDEYRKQRLVATEQQKRRDANSQQDDKGVPMPPEIKKQMEDLEKRMKNRHEPTVEFKPQISTQFDHLRTKDIF